MPGRVRSLYGSRFWNRKGFSFTFQLGQTACCLLILFYGQEWLVVCQRVRGVFLVRSWWGEVVFWLFGFSWCFVHLGGARFASHLPCVYKAWVSKMCLLLDPPMRAEFGGGHYLCCPWGVCWAAQNTAYQNCDGICGFFL